MTDQTHTKVIGACLVVASIWAGFNLKSGNSNTTPETLQTIQPIEQSTNVINHVKNNLDIEKLETLSWGRSPFYLSSLNTINEIQIGQKANQTLSWILSGIMLNNSSSIAIINKRPVKIGETIDNAIVTKIEKEKVIIKYKQKEITLTVSKG